MASRDPKKLTPLLQEFWIKQKAWYEQLFPDRVLNLSCTHRSIEEQKATYAKNRPGKILTRADGVKNLSNHNYLPSKAYDVFVTINGKSVWQEVFYIPLARSIKELGYENRIRWGGWFHSFKGDVYHFEEM